jgi:hypothetical protein
MFPLFELTGAPAVVTETLPLTLVLLLSFAAAV